MLDLPALTRNCKKYSAEMTADGGIVFNEEKFSPMNGFLSMTRDEIVRKQKRKE